MLFMILFIVPLLSFSYLRSREHSKYEIKNHNSVPVGHGFKTDEGGED